MTPTLANTPVIRTPQLHLRAPMADDWPAWRDFVASDRARHVGGPCDTGQAWRAFGHVIGHWVLRGFGSFVFTASDDPSPLGMVGPWYPADWPERELGWTVWSADAEGRGLAYEAALAARDHAFKVLGWDTAVSYIDADNTRSIALAERLGCVRDDAAARPNDDDPAPCLVYRHPAPGSGA